MVDKGELERMLVSICYVVNEQLITLQSVDISCSIAKARANNGGSMQRVSRVIEGSEK